MLDLDLDDRPARVIRYGYKSHPMYKQWKKMLDSCDDPNHKLFHLVGARGITVMHRWYDFDNFVDDNEEFFESDFDPSKPLGLRRQFIKRINLKSGFNPKNVAWVGLREAAEIQPKTILVDTIHGKGWTLKQLEKYLADNAGEDLPEGATIHRIMITEIDVETGKPVRRRVPLTTIQPIKLHELRRRYQKGLDLLAPVREYGAAERLENEREAALCAALDRQRIPVEKQTIWQRNGGA
jgi:hypothetical protein